MVRFIQQNAAGTVFAVAVFLAGVGVSLSTGEQAPQPPDLGVDAGELSPVVDNPYVPLGSLKRAVYTGRDRDPDTGRTSKVRMEMTVRETTVTLAGVKTTVVDVTAYEDGEVVERSRDFYAKHRSGAVYSIGDEVDDLTGGKIVGHEGQWVAGEGTSRAGLYMPASPKVGDIFEQERAPGIAERHSRVLATGKTIKVAAGTFSNCIETEDSDTIEKTTQRRFYCAGVGLIKETSPERSLELASRETR